MVSFGIMVCYVMQCIIYPYMHACLSVCPSVCLCLFFSRTFLVPRLQPGAVSPENTAVAALSAALLHMVSEVVC